VTKVTRPGDYDHPSEQIKRAGRPAPSGEAVYHVRLTVAVPDRLNAPSIEQIENTIAVAVSKLTDANGGEPLVKADATRTDI
jgi:hypothetical protein